MKQLNEKSSRIFVPHKLKIFTKTAIIMIFLINVEALHFFFIGSVTCTLEYSRNYDENQMDMSNNDITPPIILQTNPSMDTYDEFQLLKEPSDESESGLFDSSDLIFSDCDDALLSFYNIPFDEDEFCIELFESKDLPNSKNDTDDINVEENSTSTPDSSTQCEYASKNDKNSSLKKSLDMSQSSSDHETETDQINQTPYLNTQNSTLNPNNESDNSLESHVTVKGVSDVLLSQATQDNGHYRTSAIEQKNSNTENMELDCDLAEGALELTDITLDPDSTLQNSEYRSTYTENILFEHIDSVESHDLELNRCKTCPGLCFCEATDEEKREMHDALSRLLVENNKTDQDTNTEISPHSISEEHNYSKTNTEKNSSQVDDPIQQTTEESVLREKYHYPSSRISRDQRTIEICSNQLFSAPLIVPKQVFPYKKRYPPRKHSLMRDKRGQTLKTHLRRPQRSRQNQKTSNRKRNYPTFANTEHNGTDNMIGNDYITVYLPGSNAYVEISLIED